LSHLLIVPIVEKTVEISFY